MDILLPVSGHTDGFVWAASGQLSSPPVSAVSFNTSNSTQPGCLDWGLWEGAGKFSRATTFPTATWLHSRTGTAHVRASLSQATGQQARACASKMEGQ